MNNDLHEFDTNETEPNSTEQNTAEQSSPEPNQTAADPAATDHATADQTAAGQTASAGKTEPNSPKTKKTAYQFPPILPTHRVGTLTMGFSLIAVGIISLISIFYPGFDLTLALKLSPIIFIFLGIEIILAYFFHKQERIKYDFLSGVICFFLICGGLVLSALPTVWNYIGPVAQYARDQFESSTEDTIYSTLQSETGIESLSVNIEPFEYFYANLDSNDDTASHARVHLNISLSGPYTNEKAFAEDCRQILNKLNRLPFNFRGIYFAYQEDSTRFYLNLSDKFQFNMDTDRLTNLVAAAHDEDFEESSEEEVLSLPEDLEETVAASTAELPEEQTI